MEVVKKTKDFTIVKKRSGRFAVKGKNGKMVNGPDKTKVLIDQGLVKQSLKAATTKAESSEE